ncbi:MAG TPA: tetratricopeptide repeat protein, partial [Phycisphaerae bacterium]
RLALGSLLVNVGQLNEGAVQLEAAARLKPDQVETRNILGYVYFKLGKPEAAVQQLEASLKLRPNDAQVHEMCAEVLESLGRHDEAAAHGAQAARLGASAAGPNQNPSR